MVPAVGEIETHIRSPSISSIRRLASNPDHLSSLNSERVTSGAWRASTGGVFADREGSRDSGATNSKYVGETQTPANPFLFCDAR
jgi:hypothetical protein